VSLDSSALPSTAMPAESPQIGDGSAAAGNRKALESAGSPGPSAQGGAPAPPQGASPAPQAGPPVQPPPRVPLNQSDMQPGGPIFSAPKFAPHRGWRQEMKIMAAHPKAGPWLGALAKKIDAEEKQTGKQTSPQS
jgi:hypothetical protein